MEANDIVSFSCALCNMFKRTAVDSYGRHTGSRVKLKIFFCLYLRNDCCNIIGNRPNLKSIILSCKAEFARLSTTFSFSDVKMLEALTFFKIGCFECNGKMATSEDDCIVLYCCFTSTVNI